MSRHVKHEMATRSENKGQSSGGQPMFAAWTVCIIQLQDQRDDQPCLICSHVMSVGREFRHEMGPTGARGDDKGQSSGGCSLCLLHGLSDTMQPVFAAWTV